MNVQLRWLTILTFLPASAGASHELNDERLLDVLYELATNTGRIDACGSAGDPGWNEVVHYSERLAHEHHPGLLARLFGSRQSYFEEIEAEAEIRFRAGQQQGCPPDEALENYEWLVRAGAEMIDAELDR